MKPLYHFPDEFTRIATRLNKFDSVGLEQLKGSELMDRKEEKYAVPFEFLPHFLEPLSQDYGILEINGKRIFSYVSQYFDTANLDFFHEHRKGRLNRFKIRKRQYIDTGTTYFEVKYKDNHGRTQKSRIETRESVIGEIQDIEEQFLQKVSPYPASSLCPTLVVRYNRITLINKTLPERVTIDIDLEVAQNREKYDFEGLAIIEIKQEKLKKSRVKEVLKKMGQRPGTLSKYCLGIITLNHSIKHNRLMPLFNRIYKPFLNKFNQ